MPSRPYARSAELIVEQHNDELLVYDRRSEVAHCLTSVAALVWRNCDGETELDTLAGLVAALDPDADAEELTLRALAELDAKCLLDVAYEGRSALSRRQVVQRLAGAGMAAMAAPLVISAAAPSPAAAATGVGCLKLGDPCGATEGSNGTCCGSTTVCTRGTANPGSPKYCAPNTSCIGQGKNCAAGGAHFCCSRICGANGKCT